MERQEPQVYFQSNLPLREIVCAELEETRKKFHILLDSLSDADLRQKSTNSAWTVKEQLVHTIFWLSFTPRVVQDVRKGTGIRNVPAFLFNWLNKWLTRLAAWRQTRESIARNYDAAYHATLALIEGIRDDEWRKGASYGGVFEGEYRTIEKIIRSHRSHFDEHAAQIQQSINRR